MTPVQIVAVVIGALFVVGAVIYISFRRHAKTATRTPESVATGQRLAQAAESDDATDRSGN